MNIREASIDDLPQLAKLFDSYRVFYEKQSDVENAKRFLRERMKQGDSTIFVCEENEQLLGFTQLYPLFSSTRMKKLYLLNDLFVHKSQRGKGISKRLINKAKELAKDTGACGFFLETGKTNDVGNSLYPSAGMTLNTSSNFYEWNV